MITTFKYRQPVLTFRKASMIRKPTEYTLPMLRVPWLEGIEKGMTEAYCESIRIVLQERGLTMPDHVRLRLAECTNVWQFRRYTRRATFIESADDLFED